MAFSAAPEAGARAAENGDMLQPEQPSSLIIPLLVSAVVWAVSLASVVAGAAMTWSLAHSLELDELMARGLAVASFAPSLFVALTAQLCRDQEPPGIKITAAISTAILIACHALTVFCFLMLMIVPQPGSSSLADLAGLAPQDVAAWQRSTVVNPNGDDSRGAKERHRIRKEAQKPDPPAIPSAPRWPVQALAAAFALKPVVIYLALTVMLTLALESMAMMGPTLAMAAWRSRATGNRADAEAAAVATLQAMMMLSLAAGLVGAGRQADHTRRNPRQRERARPEPAAGAEAGVKHPRPMRRRATGDEITRDLRDLLRRGSQGEVEGIEVQADGVLLSTNRRLGTLLGRAPGAVNVCLHRLHASGEITLAASSRLTAIRMRPSGAPARDISDPAASA